MIELQDRAVALKASLHVFAAALLISLRRAHILLQLTRQRQLLLREEQEEYLTNTLAAYWQWANEYAEPFQETVGDCLSPVDLHVEDYGCLPPCWELEVSPHPLAVAVQQRCFVLFRLLLTTRQKAYGTAFFNEPSQTLRAPTPPTATAADRATAENRTAATAATDDHDHDNIDNNDNNNKEESLRDDPAEFVAAALQQLAAAAPNGFFSVEDDIGDSSNVFHMAASRGSVSLLLSLRYELASHSWGPLMLQRNACGWNPADVAVRAYGRESPVALAFITADKTARQLAGYSLYASRRAINFMLVLKLLLFAGAAASVPLCLLCFLIWPLFLLSIETSPWLLRSVAFAAVATAELAAKQSGHRMGCLFLLRVSSVFGFFLVVPSIAADLLQATQPTM